MAEWISDGFDAYASISDAALGYWDSAVSGVISATTRFGVGQSIAPAVTVGTVNLSKAVAVNDATVFLAVAHEQIVALGVSGQGAGFVFSDGATGQCGVWFETDGAIRLRAGGTIAGAILAAYTGAFVANVWNHFNIKVAINNATGSIDVKKNRNRTDATIDFTATGLNTRASANNYANKITFVSGGNANLRFDDLLVYGSSGVLPNDWVGDIRCNTRYPAADTATKAFTPAPATINFGNPTAAGGSSAFSAGFIRAGSVTPTRSGTTNSMAINLAVALVGKVNVALYADNAGAPGALLAHGTEVTNPGTGVLTFALNTTVAIVSGTKYWLAVWNNASMTLFSGTLGAISCSTETLAYASTFPDPFSQTSTTTLAAQIYFTLTPSNATMVAEAQEDGDTSYVADSVVGHADLYTIDAPTSTPVEIIGYKARMLAKKTDTNAKTARIQLKGTTTIIAADLVLATTYQWVFPAFQPTDPDTGVAWAAAVGAALTVGPKVQA